MIGSTISSILILAQKIERKKNNKDDQKDDIGGEAWNEEFVGNSTIFWQNEQVEQLEYLETTEGMAEYAGCMALKQLSSNWRRNQKYRGRHTRADSNG